MILDYKGLRVFLPSNSCRLFGFVTLLRQELTHHFINSMIQKTNEVKMEEAQGPLSSFE